MPTLSIEQWVARTLGLSRREAAEKVAAERSSNSNLPASLASEQLPFALTLGGQPIVLRESYHLMLNKPAGYVTALSDPLHPCAPSLLRQAPLWSALRPIGRLDLDTTGLLLFTTDGQWLHRLAHPKSAVPRTYEAALARPFDAPPSGFALRDGHHPEIRELPPLALEDAHPSLPRPAPTCCLARITIVGGAYHEIRRIFAALGSHVLGLCRTRFGDHRLPPELPPGGWREIAGPR